MRILRQLICIPLANMSIPVLEMHTKIIVNFLNTTTDVKEPCLFKFTNIFIIQGRLWQCSGHHILRTNWSSLLQDGRQSINSILHKCYLFS